MTIYTHASAAENQANLEGQAKRLQDYCAAKGYQVAAVVKEIGFAVNDARPKWLKLLTDAILILMAACAPRSGMVEHKDHLTRLGFNSIEQWLKLQDRRLEVSHLSGVADAERGKEDLVQDFVNSETSFCARLYGQRRSKRKMERLIVELQAEELHGEESAHSS